MLHPATNAPRSRIARVPLALLIALALAGCGRESRSNLVSPDATSAPVARTALSVTLTPADGDRFVARIHPDVANAARVEYAIDPPASGEPAWQKLQPGDVALTLARRAQPYVVLVRTVSNAGVISNAQRVAFTADNVVAQAIIVSPIPTHEQPVTVPVDFTISWTGIDPEAPNGVPVGYLFRLVTADAIDPANPNGITAVQIQQFFSNDLATNRAGWTETTELQHPISGGTPTTIYYFALVAKDTGGEPGALSGTFNLDSNVLEFRPSLGSQGPSLTVFNALFYRTRTSGSTAPRPDITVSVQAGQPIDFNWFGVPVVGGLVTGYRWALDLADSSDESARRNDKDLDHWSTWSLVTTSATVGPFSPGDAKKGAHQLWIEARDNLDRVSRFVVAIDVTRKGRPTGDLLLVDDLYGTASDRLADGSIPYKGAFPMEAEQDSFYNAVGGFPDELRRHGTPTQPGDGPDAISEPGAFAGFDYDTLDYRFWPEEGISVLGGYRAVAWYTDQGSAARSGSKFGSLNPSTALRLINMVNRLNQLAVYVQNGGKLLLFGDGSTTAIANGYWSRIAAGAPRLPYTSGESPNTNVLRPGDFLYDFCHLRSELNTAGTPSTSLTKDQQLQAAIPYLPEFAGPASATDRTHDPRIGPGAARTAVRWSGLPRLTLAAYRTANASPALRSVNLTWVVTQPLRETEGSRNRTEPVLDTLYLCQAIRYDPDHVQIPASDGFPNALDYHGSEHGEVVWFGFPLYYFERTQARQVVATVMRVFGIAPLPPGVKQGPGTASPPAAAGEATALDVTRPVVGQTP